VAAPLENETCQQQQTDEGGACDVQSVTIVVVVIQHEQAECVGQVLLEIPGKLLAPVMLESDTPRFWEHARRVQHGHRRVGDARDTMTNPKWMPSQRSARDRLRRRYAMSAPANGTT
jgi:hypothetical protein